MGRNAGWNDTELLKKLEGAVFCNPGKEVNEKKEKAVNNCRSPQT